MRGHEKGSPPAPVSVRSNLWLPEELVGVLGNPRHRARRGPHRVYSYINLSETINNHAACLLGVVRDRSMFHLLVRWSSTAAVDSRELNTFLSARDDPEPGVTWSRYHDSAANGLFGEVVGINFLVVQPDI